MNDLNKAQRHLRRRDDYYNNALKYAATGKFSKASEFLWGAVTNKIKEYWMYGLGYEFGCAVKVNRDLSFEVTVIHRGSEKVFSHSDVRIIAPQNIQSFQTFINPHQDVDRDELNNLVKEHYTLELPNNEV